MILLMSRLVKDSGGVGPRIYKFDVKKIGSIIFSCALGLLLASKALYLVTFMS